MTEYDELKHFEKLLDEFEEDALAAAIDPSSKPPSASKRQQYHLTRRNVLAFVEGIVLEKDKNLDDATEVSRLEDSLEAMQKERDLLHEYLYDSVGDMSSLELQEASRAGGLDYCQAILDKASEFIK